MSKYDGAGVITSEKRDYFGRLHAVGEPALVWAIGSEVWFRHGAIHRTCGPAEIYRSTKPFQHYFSISGRPMPFAEWLKQVEHMHGPRHAALMKLKWSAHAIR